MVPSSKPSAGQAVARIVEPQEGRPAAAAQPSSASALVEAMSERNPPSHTTPGPTPSRRRYAIRRASRLADRQKCGVRQIADRPRHLNLVHDCLVLLDRHRDAVDPTEPVREPAAFYTGRRHEATAPDPPPSPRRTCRLLAGRTILQIVPELDAGGAERTAVDIAARPRGRPARAPWWRRRAAGWSASCRPRAASGSRSRPAPRTPSRCWPTPGGCAPSASSEGVDIIHARSRAPAWSALMARAARWACPSSPPIRAAMPAARRVKVLLQFRHGARRRRHRQFQLHGRPHRPAASLRARARARHPPRHGPARLLAACRRAGARGEAAARLGRRSRTSASCCWPPG